MLADDGKAMLYLPSLNYVNGTLDAVGEQLAHPSSVVGLSDGGAHVGTICDVSFPTSLLQWWGRDRPNGRLPVELLVHKQTQATAETVGLLDRGLLAPGYRGDVNVIDFDGLRLHTPGVPLRPARPAVAASSSGPTATCTRSSPAPRSARTASRPAPRPAASSAAPSRALSRPLTAGVASPTLLRRATEEASISSRKIGQAGSSITMWLRLGSDTKRQSGISEARSRADDSGTRRSSRECSTSVGQRDLRRQLGDVDLGERLEEAHRVLRPTSCAAAAR